MVYVAAVTTPLVLFLAFVFMTAHEARTGVRFFESIRKRLDMLVSHAALIVRHIDVGSLTWRAVRELSERIIHVCAEFSLVAVRALERFLTRVVRVLRSRYASLRGAETVEKAPQRSTFLEKITHFKKSLRTSKPSESTPDENTLR